MRPAFRLCWVPRGSRGVADVVCFDWRFRDAGLIAPDRQGAALTLGPAERLVHGWPSPAATVTLMRRGALVGAGGFDGRYHPLATAEAALRLAQAGARFRHSPDLVLEFAPRRLDPAGLAQHLDEALRMVRSGQAALPSQARALAGAETEIFFHALGLAIGAGLQTQPLIDHPPVALAPGFEVARGDMAAFLADFRGAPAAEPSSQDIAFDGRLPAVAAAAVDWAGRPPEPAGRAPPGVPVLMYHRIAADAPPAMARFATTPARFTEQLQWLAESDRVTIGLDALEAAIWDGGPLPERAVALTFDDGYQDTLTNSAPILRDPDQRATVFVPTAHVGGAADWDRLFGLPAPLMDWAGLERLRRAGVDLASHGQRHRPMTTLPPRYLAHEREGARKMLLARLGVTTNFLAYPYGDHDEAVQRAALAAGSRLAFTTENRRWRPGDRVATIPRIEVTGGLTSDGFAALLRTD